MNNIERSCLIELEYSWKISFTPPKVEQKKL